ncbi:uncharacterized protein LOC113762854 [Coffea eugenioides]|uniref:uncharacterized protein LOC113762854 n=1 Tax=Coffea eugenioides TaxID=49369 RepID=UPI000F5C4A44|nr:uncharacterized protein LOC113732938 [Coffea arabica]XP_027114798.1 uncharacterized protein LOC113732938 [Coffea arabica]XP_027162271.1 uncharacterized protein LOC113762854 [Coffea eugenioides]
MTMDERVEDLQNRDETQKAWSISAHAFSDLSHVSPLMFLYLLKESYTCGELKASAKFRRLKDQVLQVLHNGPKPGPAIFVAQCLYILPIFDTYRNGFSHLIISALHHFLKSGTTQEDKLEAKLLAAKLFLLRVQYSLVHDEKVLVKILEVFDVSLTDIEIGMQDLDAKGDVSPDTAKVLIEQYVSKLIESESFMTAISLLERFSIQWSGEPFLLQMIQCNKFRAAERWATFMGKPMLQVLVQEYVKQKQLKPAYDVIKENNLCQEFPEVCQQYKESLLKKLAEHGCWDNAEAKAKGNRQYLEYVVYLAMEAGYVEKVEELCTKYSLEGFENVKKTEANLRKSCYLHLDDLCIEDVVWVDEVDGLRDATFHLEEFKVVGLDSEWKPNYEKGSAPNKVSIMQIASETKVYILDLIKLYDSDPDSLNQCLSRILHSSRILKLGYNFQCDIKQLAYSYQDLQCFEHYEMLLDIQNVFKEHRGGLSGLAEKVLGRGLNKTRRNSNWEKRPLSIYQLEYAALDAAVLLHIFRHVRDHVQPSAVANEHSKIEWKSYIVSHKDKVGRIKKRS